MRTSNPLSAGGEMGMQIGNFDWSPTPLGHIDSWPVSLRITLSTMLHSPVPTCLIWGPELICFYNDAFRPSLAKVHQYPSILGKPARQAWPELWDKIHIETDRAFEKGDTILSKLIRFEIHNNETPARLFLDLSYSPTFTEHGRIAGVLFTETSSVSNGSVGDLSQDALAGQLEVLDLFENTPVSIASLSADKALRFLSANRSYGELVGRDPASIIGIPLLDALPELRGQGFDELLYTVIRSGSAHTAYEIPVKLTRQNNLETVFVNFSYVPRFDADQRVTGILVTATDVSFQVRSRKAVEEKEALLRSLVHAAPFPIGVYVGEDLRILHANPAIIQVYGKGPDVIGKGYLELLPELMQQGIGQQVMDVYRSGRAFFSETSRVDINVDGAIISYYFKYSFIPLFDGDDKVYGILNTGVDVTEVEMARQRALEAESTLRSAVELAELADWNIEIGNNTFNLSERLKTWIGSENLIVTVTDFFELVPEGSRQQVSEAYTNALLASGSTAFSIEHPLLNTINGHQRYVQVRGQLITDRAGNPFRLTGTMQDITEYRSIRWALERKVAERTTQLAEANAMLSELNTELEHKNTELNRSNEELSQYAYVTSHDLQEPLRKIRMYISWLQEKFEMPAESRELLEKINRSCSRMTQLIKDLLSFSRLLGGNMHVQPVDLHQVVSAVLEDFELAIQEKKAIVQLDPLPVVNAVSLQLNQLFHNLIGNALKFTSPDRIPSISISVRLLAGSDVSNFISQSRHRQFYEIAVSDNGIGFEQQYADHIFELFRQLHTRNRYPGSGIGLALCRRIATNHEGYIYATSTPGEGSVFRLLLPVNDLPVVSLSDSLSF